MIGASVVNEREITVVMRGSSAVIFRQSKNLLLKEFPSEVGRVNIIYTSRWIKRNENVTVPGDMWIEIRGKGDSLEKSLVPFANAGLAILPLISVSTNAAIGDPEVELGFDNTPNVSERDYFQSYVPPESGVVHLGRVIDVKLTVALLDAIDRHRDGERIRRAANQYRLALNSWKFGKETLSLAHLWMALEALTKVKIRSELEDKEVETKQELADSLGVRLDQLDPTIRRDQLLNGDVECYTKSKKASDGFEHGFLGYGEIRELSKSVRHRMARYIRNAILELSGLGEEPLKNLTEDPFDEPMGYWPIVKYVRGRLVGESSQLAAKDNMYPFLRWKPVISKCEVRDDGKMNIQFNENLTAELGEGISFQPSSFEAWEPK